MKPLTTPLAFGYITVKFTTSLEANFRTVPKDIFSFSTTSSITASFDCRYSNVPAGPDFMYVKSPVNSHKKLFHAGRSDTLKL